ncbi:MAG: hypothetical protein K2Y08_07000 [Alphaproteobacteria bacterium]|nr:hypothetical protein [Alphaproteobacteria bacterium]
MSKSMKFVSVAALGLGIFQNFGAEAVKIESSDCSTENLCINDADNGKKYVLDNASRENIMKAWNKTTDFEESDSKLIGTVTINGEKVKLSYDQKKD